MAARRINLLPAEIAEIRRAQQRKVAIAIAAAGVVVLLIAVFLFTVMRLGNEQDRLDTAQARVDNLRAQVASLKDIDDLDKEVKAKTKLVADLTEDEVRWSVLLADVAMVIPSDAWLTSFSGNVTPPEAGVAATEDVVLGTIQMNGTTFTHLDVAKWLSRLVQVDGFTFPYLSLSSKAKIGSTEVVNFNSTVQLSEKAFRREQPGARRVL